MVTRMVIILMQVIMNGGNISRGDGGDMALVLVTVVEVLMVAFGRDEGDGAKWQWW